MAKRPDRYKPRPREAQTFRLVPDERKRGSEFYRIKDEQLRREPLCRACMAGGRAQPAVVADHIIPLADGGRETASNRQSLCKACHDSKTAAENARRPKGEGGV